jgi:hypothetical protein
MPPVAQVSPSALSSVLNYPLMAALISGCIVVAALSLHAKEVKTKLDSIGVAVPPPNYIRAFLVSAIATYVIMRVLNSSLSPGSPLDAGDRTKLGGSNGHVDPTVDMMLRYIDRSDPPF